MGANSQQGWSLLLFIVGFTFLPAGLVALGPIFTIAGLASLIVSAVWFYRIKPLEHSEPEKAPEPASIAARAKQAV
jgi:membrane-bound ClpP family serine protease